MITSYSTEALSKLEVVEESQRYLDNKFISEEQFQQIKGRFDHQLFVPNVFVRIGLFVLTFLGTSAAFGMFLTFIVFSSSNSTAFAIYALIFGVISAFALEAAISSKKAFRAGIDDCLLYYAVACAITGLCLLIDPSSDNEMLVYSMIAFPFFVAGAIRYLDNALTVCAFISLLLIVFFTLFKLGGIAKAIAPFIMMLCSGAIYFQSRKMLDRENLHFWKANIQTLQFCGLMAFYLSGNYFVVRELSVELLDLYLKPNEDIPLSFVFHFTTLVVPIAYLYFGGKEKNRWMFWCGLICLALTVFTFKYYYSIAPIGYSLIISGIFVAGLAWFCIKYFSTIRWGISSDKKDEFKTNDLEGLVISYSFPIKQAPVNDGFEMGGGDFGGAGAGGKY